MSEDLDDLFTDPARCRELEADEPALPSAFVLTHAATGKRYVRRSTNGAGPSDRRDWLPPPSEEWQRAHGWENGEPPHTYIWQSADYDYPCTPTGREWSDDAGRIYAEVLSDDGTSTVPKDELRPKDQPPNPGPQPAPGAAKGPDPDDPNTRIDPPVPGMMKTPRGKLGQHDTGGLDEWDAGDDPGPIPPRQWLLANQFCRGFISSLVAAGGIGKSALRLLQFISLALGRPLSGQHVFRRCRVLLISLEDDRDELQRRIEAVLVHFGIDRRELQGWLFCATPTGRKLAELKDGKRVVGQLEQQIRAAITRRQPDLVAIDPFVKLHSLGENDSADMNFVCDLLIRIAVDNKIAVDIPHHVHKGLIAPGDADAARGSSGIRDAGRLIFTLTPMSEDEANMYGIELDERLGHVRLDSAKVNIAPRGGNATWFQIIGVPIGNATEDYPKGDTIQVVRPWQPPDTWAGLDNSLLNQILSAIDAGVGDGNFYTATNSTTERAAWRVVMRFAQDKTNAQAREIINAWIRSGLLLKFDYTNPKTRREVKGLRVDASKRPGTV